MSSMPLSLTSNTTANALPLLNTFSMIVNPYSVIAQSVDKQRTSMQNPHILTYATTLALCHFILLIQAAISLTLKVLVKRNGQRTRFWLWRRQFVPDQRFPYFVPNGYLLPDILQLIGCMAVIWFALSIYQSLSDPTGTPLAVRYSGVFWLGICYMPGYIGFWLSGWSAIYVCFFSRTGGQTKSPLWRFLRNPLVMNTICVGVTISILVYFLSIAIALSITYPIVWNSYVLLLRTLHRFAKSWKPNDLETIQNNRYLFHMVESMGGKSKEILEICHWMAYGWAAVSMFITMFYLSATLALGMTMKRTLTMASGKKYPQNSSKEDSNSSQNQSNDYLNPKFNNEKFATKLRRNYYFIFISCSIITITLGFNFTASMLVGLKAKFFLVETYWQGRLFILVTCSTVFLSASLFIQSLLLIWA